jgi:hypothetical protein
VRKLLSTIATLVIAAGFAGFGVASLTVGASATMSQTAGKAGSALQLAQINHYETPCHKREREARGIPKYSVDESKGYMAWYRSNWETPEWNDWNAAASNCRLVEPVEKWRWDGMILVSVEYI